MEGLFTLLALGAVMALASFLAGSLPLSLSMSPSRLRLISTIGMGVLVGTSLIVIIPEGVEALYSAMPATSSHTTDRIRSEPTISAEQKRTVYLAARDDASDVDPFLMPGLAFPPGMDAPPATPTKPGVVGILEETTSRDNELPQQTEGQDDHNHGPSPHAWIGVALISGFIMMFLIDKLPHYLHAGKSKSKTHHIALNNLGRRFNMATTLDRDEEADGFLDGSRAPEAPKRSFATTTGLVIHAAADGVALGASSTASSGLSFIIFFAIMVHKAPAAFGLTSLLLKQGLSKRTARAHLLLFSLAAPIGSLLTWTLAHVLTNVQTSKPQSTKWWTGILLLFSAGTFLYVAMHSMREVTSDNHTPAENGHANGSLDRQESQDVSPQEEKPSLRDLGAACFGMILPLFLQIGHAH